MYWTNSLHLGDMATPAYHIMLGRNRSRASQRCPPPPGRPRAATQSDGTDRRTTKTGLANLPRDVAWGFAVLFQG